jgi:chromosome segregation ATPase
MNRTLETALRISTTTSGKEHVEQLKQALIGLGVGADTAGDMAEEAGKQIEALGGRRKAIADLEAAFRAMGLSEREAAQAAAETVKGLDAVGEKADKTKFSVDGLARQLAGLVTTGKIIEFARDSVEAYGQAEAAFRGLEAQAKYSGVSIGRAMDEANKLAEDGLIDVASASKALQNLLSRGYSIEQAVDTLNWLKDAAAFNRQANLSLADAVKNATEGLKNENSTLVDNAGVTKNVAKMWEEYANRLGIAATELTQAQKIEAEYQGIMQETQAQVGNAAKALEGYQGQAAAAAKASQDAAIQMGQALAPAATEVSRAQVWLIENGLKPMILWAKRTGTEFALMATQVGTVWDAIKRMDFSDLGKKLDANIALANEQMREYERQIKTNTLEIAKQAVEADKGGEVQARATRLVREAERLLDEQRKVNKKTLDDQLKAAEASVKVVQAENKEIERGLKIVADRAKGELALAQAKGSAYEITLAKNKVAEAEYQLASQQAEAQREEAEATLRAAQEKYALAKSRNDNVEAAARELDAAAKAYESSVLNALATEEEIAARKRLNLEIEDAIKRRQREAESAKAQAATVAAAWDIYNSETRGKLGSTQAFINQFGADLQAIGAGMTWHVNAMRKEFAALGPAAEDAFNTMLSGARDVFGPGGLLTTGPASPLAQMRDKMETVTEQSEAWVAKLNDAGASLADVDQAMRWLNTSTIPTYSNLHALGQERAQPLLDALDQARRRLADLRDSAADTLSTLRDELDELNANYDDIERRRAKQREEDIQAQLAAARAAGDQKTIADLTESLRLLKQINAARLEEAKRREAEAASSRNTTSPAPSTSGNATGGVSTTHRVVITLPAGGTQTVNMASSTDASTLAALLSQLSVDKLRAN